MPPRDPLALQIDFDAPETVSEVYAEPLPHDGDDEFEEDMRERGEDGI